MEFVLETTEFRRKNMKKIIIGLLFCMCGGILNAFEYHFPNNGMKIYSTHIMYDREQGKIMRHWNDFGTSLEKILEITFETKHMGHKPIQKILEELDEAPADYFRFYEILTRYTSHDPQFLDTKVNFEIYFPDAVVGFYSNTLQIIEKDFRRAVKKLKVGEEKPFLKIEFVFKDELWERESKSLHLSNIKVDRKIVPSTIIMKCKRMDKQIANCWFVNEQGEDVSELVGQWDISYPQDLLKEIKQETQEIKQAQKNRKRLLEKECPNLYRTLYNAQQGYYVEPARGIIAAQRFEELGCAEWLQE